MRRIATFAMLCTLVALPLLAGDAPANPTAACCLKNAGAQRTVANLDNGVKITITGADAKLVTMIQEETASCPKPGCSKDCPMQAKGVRTGFLADPKAAVLTFGEWDRAGGVIRFASRWYCRVRAAICCSIC